MKLSDLVLLVEAAEPVEIATLAANFPNTAAKAISQMLIKDRLLFNTRSFNDVYVDAVDKAENTKQTVELDLDINAYKALEAIGADHWSSLNVEVEIDSAQEVYGGWSPTEPDCLYIGFDAWVNEEDFNEQFDKAFKKETGKSFDHDDESHSAIYSSIYESFRKNSTSSYLMKVKIGSNGVPIKATTELAPGDAGNGMFYKAIYKSQSLKDLHLIDLRLD